MKAYELLFFVNPAIDEESRLAANKRIENVITADGGVIDKADNWGKRKLAYEINYETEGTYVLWSFNSKTEFPAELERVLGITDGVIRFLITTK
jgi:small subunit ribosomal protein S6